MYITMTCLVNLLCGYVSLLMVIMIYYWVMYIFHQVAHLIQFQSSISRTRDTYL